MSRKIVALVLMLALVCPMLFACGADVIDKAQDYLENNKIDNTRETVTVSFFIVSEIDVAPEALSAMQLAFNMIVEKKYDTHVEFTFVNKTDYATKLDEKLKSVEEAKTKKGELTAEEYSAKYPTTAPTNVATTDKEFPGVPATQFDIFLSVDPATFISYIENNDILDLTSYVNSKWRSFSDVQSKATAPDNTIYNPTVSDVIFSNAYYFKQVYANASAAAASEVQEMKLYYGIPSTFVVGKYDYLFVKKEEADKYYIHMPEEATGDASKAVLESVETLKAELTTAGKSEGDINDAIITLSNVNHNTMPDGINPALYYRTILKKPQATYDEITKNMFCVSKNTANVERCFEVLYELYTNKELHTILQYGAPNDQYTLNPETETITLKSGAEERYKMDLTCTGNMFCIYPCEGDAVIGSYEALKMANDQNNDAAKPVIPTNKYYTLQLSIRDQIKVLYDALASEAEKNEEEALISEDSTYKYFTIDSAPYAAILKEMAQKPDGVVELRIAHRAETEVTSAQYGYVMHVSTEIPPTDPNKSPTKDVVAYSFFVESFDKNGEHKASVSFGYASSTLSFNTEYTYNIPYATVNIPQCAYKGILWDENKNEVDVNCTADVKVTASSFTSDVIEKGEALLLENANGLSDIDIETGYIAEFVLKFSQSLTLFNMFYKTNGNGTVSASDLGFASFK